MSSWAQGQIGWAEDTGKVWLRNDGTNILMENFADGRYYQAKAIPKALIAQVQSKSGSNLVLTGGQHNGYAQATATNANIYRDGTADLNTALAAAANSTQVNANTVFAGQSSAPIFGVISIPAGKTAVDLVANSAAAMRLYSPKGAPMLQIEIHGANCDVADITLQGNAGDNGYGLNWAGSTNAMMNQPLNDGGGTQL